MAELSKIPFVEGCVDKSSNTPLKLALLVPPLCFLCAYPGNTYPSSQYLCYTTDGSKAPHMEISERTINSILQCPPRSCTPETQCNAISSIMAGASNTPYRFGAEMIGS
jgi:hypothetical protein